MLTAVIPKGPTSVRLVVISDIKEMKSRWLWREGGEEEGGKRKERKALKCPSRTHEGFTFQHLGQEISQSSKIEISQSGRSAYM